MQLVAKHVLEVSLVQGRIQTVVELLGLIVYLVHGGQDRHARMLGSDGRHRGGVRRVQDEIIRFFVGLHGKNV